MILGCRGNPGVPKRILAFPDGSWGAGGGFGGHSRVCTLLLRVSESRAWTYS